MNDIIKIFQALEDSNIVLKGITKTTENEIKDEKGGLSTLGASLLGNMLTGKIVLRESYRNKEGKRIVRAGYGNKKGKGILTAAYASKIDF